MRDGGESGSVVEVTGERRGEKGRGNLL